MAKSSLLAPTMYGPLHSGMNTMHKKVRGGEASNKRSTKCVLRKLDT